MRADIDLGPGCNHDVGCITCGDEAVTMRVLRVDESRGLALCANAEGSKSTIEIELLDGVAPGDAVLVHAGVALQRLSEDPIGAPEAGLGEVHA